MGDWSSVFDLAETGLQEATKPLIDFAFSLALVALILVAGWALARLLRAVIGRTAIGLNQMFEQVFLHEALEDIRLTPRAVAALGELIFWITIFLSVVIAARAAELTAVAGWLDQIAQQIPNLVIGGGLIFIGYVIAKIAGDQVAVSARSTRSQHSDFLGKLVQAAIFVTALIVGLDQIGVEVTFLVALFASIFGAACVGFAIAFGLGAREFVGNMLGARMARRELASAKTVRVGDVEGTLLEITATHLAIDTEQGRTLVPAHILSVQSFVEIIKEDIGPENGKP